MSNGAKHFSSGIFQNYFVFISAKKYFKYFTANTRNIPWKSNGASEENFENITKSVSNFAPSFVDYHILPDIIFNGHCLINNNIFIRKNIINMYISYTLIIWLRDLNTVFTSGNCLFGSAELTKSIDPDKYKYSGYGWHKI